MVIYYLLHQIIGLTQTFHCYESKFLKDYKKIYNEYPILNDNCDPE